MCTYMPLDKEPFSNEIVKNYVYVYVYYYVCMYYVCIYIFDFSSEHKESKDVKIVAVDLQAMSPIPGVIQIQGDITKVRMNVCST